MTDPETTVFSKDVADAVFAFTAKAATLPEVKTAVEANHDQNRWWPTTISDPRTRMLIAGWSTRISYAMVNTYASVAARVDELGFDTVTALDDAHLLDLVQPLGLPDARIAYLRSLTAFLRAEQPAALHDDPADELIARFAARVHQASFKVAQCALLYARGYHCGVIPVDSGMVTKLAPALGFTLPSGPAAHEKMRHLLQAAVTDRPAQYRALAEREGYRVTIPKDAAPTWLVHLVLIYTKRAHLNRESGRLCPKRPVCEAILDCKHVRRPQLES